MNTCDTWHVSASSGVVGVHWRYLIINVSVVSFCRWFVTEIPRRMLKTKLSLLCAFAASGTQGQAEAEARCGTGCIFRHAVPLWNLLFRELCVVLTSVGGSVFLQWGRK